MKPLQGVNDFNEGLLHFPVAVEIKHDGWGIFAREEIYGVVIRTRTGQVLDLPVVKRELEKKHLDRLSGTFLHGELTHPDGFQAIKGAIATEDPRLVFNVFAQVDEGFFAGKSGEFYYNSRSHLECIEETEHVKVVGMKYLKTVEEIMAEYEAALEAGHEGLVIKRKDSRYNSGKTNDWLRLKPTETQDCEIVDYELKPVGVASADAQKDGIKTEEHTFSTLKSLTVLDERGVTCRVGAGISNHDREMYARLGAGALGMIVEVKHRGRFASGRMRHATYSRLRDDRPSRLREESVTPSDEDIDALTDALAAALEDSE